MKTRKFAVNLEMQLEAGSPEEAAELFVDLVRSERHAVVLTRLQFEVVFRPPPIRHPEEFQLLRQALPTLPAPPEGRRHQGHRGTVRLAWRRLLLAGFVRRRARQRSDTALWPR